MIISHKYKFIFIKTVKTAGTSVEVYLSPHCGPRDILTPIQPPVEGHQPRNAGGFYHHFSAWGARQAVPEEIWDSYYKFCVERNPWDKTISDYGMAHHRSGGKLDFQTYLNLGRFCNSWELYTDNDDKTILVDEVLRYERLNEELGRVFERLGVPWAGQLEIFAKSQFRQDRRPYREWYSEKQKQRIAAAFAREIREFGYEF
jgi:hypothetical protein